MVVSDKSRGRCDARLTAENSEDEGKHGAVAKVERGLEQAEHLGLEEEVVDGVEIDVKPRRRACKEACPMPAVILMSMSEIA